MDAPLYNLKNETVGTVALSEGVFAVRWSPVLIAQVLRAQLANRRTPLAHAKGRGEVRGGGRKPWRQKGTGRARHGSSRSPIWVGGGKSHGPSKERDYTQKIPKEMKRRALFSALSKKMKEKEVKFFDTLVLESAKTKALSGTLRPILSMKKDMNRFDVLLVGEKGNMHLARASANLPKTKTITPEALNLYDIMNYAHIFIDQHAVKTIERHYKVTNQSQI